MWAFTRLRQALLRMASHTANTINAKKGPIHIREVLLLTCSTMAIRVQGEMLVQDGASKTHSVIGHIRMHKVLVYSFCSCRNILVEPDIPNLGISNSRVLAVVAITALMPETRAVRH